MTPSPVLLALYANTNGFGYACFGDNRLDPIDYGVVKPRPFQTFKVLNRFEKIVDFYWPTILIVQDYKNSRHRKRVQEIIDGVCNLAAHKNICVYHYTRQQIRDVFEIHQARTKYEIAQKIVEAIPVLAPRMPKLKKFWTPTDYNMPLFDAVSLVLTHQYITE